MVVGVGVGGGAEVTLLFVRDVTRVGVGGRTGGQAGRVSDREVRD